MKTIEEFISTFEITKTFHLEDFDEGVRKYNQNFTEIYSDEDFGIYADLVIIETYESTPAKHLNPVSYSGISVTSELKNVVFYVKDEEKQLTEEQLEKLIFKAELQINENVE